MRELLIYHWAFHVSKRGRSISYSHGPNVERRLSVARLEPRETIVISKQLIKLLKLRLHLSVRENPENQTNFVSRRNMSNVLYKRFENRKLNVIAQYLPMSNACLEYFSESTEICNLHLQPLPTL